MEDIQRTAQLIKKVKRVLFLTSAGMSADSNIPTFRDKEGYWKNFPPFKEKGLEAQELASPWAFRNVLSHAWAFYEWRRRNAAENDPHEGYHIVNRWMKEICKDSFIHTTNTDGYHIRSGASPGQVKEVHGSMWRLQCLNSCTNEFWEDESVPLCELDFESMEASRYPLCRNCDQIARPHILMFGDFEYVGHRKQEEKFHDFMNADTDLALLIGSSGAVPTNDFIALSLKKKGATVININPDLSSDSIVRSDIFIRMKSREALMKIEGFLIN